MLTASQFIAALRSRGVEVSEITIRTRARRGGFPGARLKQTPIGNYWEIPAHYARSYEVKTGRPKRGEELVPKPRRKAARK